jgi:DNA replication and repair protein RecF
MFLRDIGADSFRNLDGHIVWGSGLNVLHGNNGEGKSNWLEAIYLLAHAKSFRTRQLNETISFGSRQASVWGTVVRGSAIERELQVDVQASSKKTLVNGKREPLARYAAQLHAICFTADELEVIRGGPDARRGFLDRGAISQHPSYAQTLADYNKVIKQKRLLLQQGSEGRTSFEALMELIQPWNEQLAKLGSLIHNARTAYVQQLHDALDHNLFSDNISIRYVSSLDGKGDLSDYQALLAWRLQARMQPEMYSGSCLVGPHRDDLQVLFGGRDLRSFGSSGQQRSALITLDLAALSVYYSKHQDYPVFLIDDVDAELDGRRIDRLLESLEGRTQTFVTTSKRNHFERFNSRAGFYEVTSGCAREDQGLSAVMATGAMS